MRVVVAGASGFIGPALVSHLRSAGHDVLRLVRRPASAPDEISWEPATGELDPSVLAGVQAGINLAGVPLADKRWGPQLKREIRSSRTDSARTLAEALTTVGAEIMLQASAMGIYGRHHHDDVLSESAPPGSDFLADVCVDWEEAAHPAVDAGLRVAYLRTGLVMGVAGGAFAPVLRALRLGVGGPMGRGDAWWSWITLLDEVRAIRFLLENDVDGPVNLVAPQPVPNRLLIRAIGRAIHRPALLNAPAPALRLLIGEFADEVLASRRIIPGVLLDAGFQFTHPSVEEAVGWLATDGRVP